MKYFHEMHILKLYQILNNEFISFYKFVSDNKEEQCDKITPDIYYSNISTLYYLLAPK